MAKKYYDTSKYISLPVALIGATTVLILLVLVGLKYSAFQGGLLSAKVPDPQKIEQYCKTIQSACKQIAITKKTDCRLDAYKNKAACLKAIPANHPYKTKLQQDCEDVKQIEFTVCEETFTQSVAQCDVDFKACIKPSTGTTPSPATSSLQNTPQATPYR